MISNDDKGVKTSNLFEHLQNEDTKEEMADEKISKDTDDVIKEKQNKAKNKSYKKMRNDRQRKNGNHKKEKVQKKCSMKRNETMSSIVVKRCHGCHFEHFPLPKFCRWWEERKATKIEPCNETRQLSIEESLSVKKYIQYLEDKFDEIP